MRLINISTVETELDRLRISPFCQGDAIHAYAARVNENFALITADVWSLSPANSADKLLIQIFAIRVAACALLIAERGQEK